MKISPAVKVGLLTIISLIILIMSIMWLKGRAISTGTRIDIAFRDVDGLRPGSAVQMMGLRIGQVEEVIPVIDSEKSYVKVRFVITEPGIEIPKASTISIQQSGIIGEKFLEISPPKLRIIYLPISKSDKEIIHRDAPVELLVNNKYITAGKVKTVEVIDTKTLSYSQQSEIGTKYAYKIGYIITIPGLVLPDYLFGDIVKNNSNPSLGKLRLKPLDNFIVKLPEIDSDYTIIEPLRIKDFLDIQVKTAESMYETNERINAVMSTDTIEDLKTTLANIKAMTAKASDTFDKANLLLETSKDEIDTVMALATRLTDKITLLSDNINGIVGDPGFKNSILSTAESVDKSTKKLSQVLSDPKTQETIKYINETSKNLAEISASLNEITQDKQLKSQFEVTLTNLNNSMSKLSKSLENVNSITAEQETSIRQILQDTSETSKNLRKFSEKLNKRFLLMRLMF